MITCACIFWFVILFVGESTSLLLLTKYCFFLSRSIQYLQLVKTKNPKEPRRLYFRNFTEHPRQSTILRISVDFEQGVSLYVARIRTNVWISIHLYGYGSRTRSLALVFQMRRSLQTTHPGVGT